MASEKQTPQTDRRDNPTGRPWTPPTVEILSVTETAAAVTGVGADGNKTSGS